METSVRVASLWVKNYTQGLLNVKQKF